MRDEAIRCIDVIKQHGIDITIRNEAINDDYGKRKVRISEVGDSLSCWRHNCSRDGGITHQIEVDRLFLRILVRITQQYAESLLICGILHCTANRGKEWVANVGDNQANRAGLLGTQAPRHEIWPVP